MVQMGQGTGMPIGYQHGREEAWHSAWYRALVEGMAEFGCIPLWCNMVQMGLGMALCHFGTMALWQSLAAYHFGVTWYR